MTANVVETCLKNVGSSHGLRQKDDMEGLATLVRDCKDKVRDAAEQIGFISLVSELVQEKVDAKNLAATHVWVVSTLVVARSQWPAQLNEKYRVASGPNNKDLASSNATSNSSATTATAAIPSANKKIRLKTKAEG